MKKQCVSCEESQKNPKKPNGTCSKVCNCPKKLKKKPKDFRRSEEKYEEEAEEVEEEENKNLDSADFVDLADCFETKRNGISDCNNTQIQYTSPET